MTHPVADVINSLHNQKTLLPGSLHDKRIAQTQRSPRSVTRRCAADHRHTRSHAKKTDCGKSLGQMEIALDDGQFYLALS